jgi:hypothetical protein
MLPPKGTTQSDNPAVQKKVVTPPTLEQLSKLACLLSKGESEQDESGAAVRGVSSGQYSNRLVSFKNRSISVREIILFLVAQEDFNKPRIMSL